MSVVQDLTAAVQAERDADERARRAALPLSEIGLAERFVRDHGDNFRFDHSTGIWLAWDDRRWACDKTGKVEVAAKATIRALPTEAADILDTDRRREITKFALRAESDRFVRGMLNRARVEPSVAITGDALDASPNVLNVQNGTIDLRTGTLRPHRRGDLLSKLAQVRFDPAATAPRFLRFLQEIYEPHPDLIEFTQFAAGYTLTGHTREHCLFLAHGPRGRNGKGVLLGTQQSLLGEYAMAADFATFVSHRNNGPRDDIANMRGCRLVVAQESREGSAFAESLIKTLTGGDVVRARRLYENAFEFTPTFKVWLATNHAPTVRGGDPAIWSRIRMMEFAVSFEGREDRGLKDDLLGELSGILNWAIKGAREWYEQGLPIAASVKAATSAYRAEQDQLGRFFDDACLLGDPFRGRARAIYQAYRAWVQGVGEDAITETAFGRRMLERGFERRQERDGNWYHGIGLREDGR